MSVIVDTHDPYIPDGQISRLRDSRHSHLDSISASMSSTRHAVVRGPSFTGCGNRPVFTPAHHAERLIGMGPGGKIALSRTKPIFGKFDVDIIALNSQQEIALSRRNPVVAMTLTIHSSHLTRRSHWTTSHDLCPGITRLFRKFPFFGGQGKQRRRILQFPSHAGSSV